MIIRIFRVRVREELMEEFEKQFNLVSLPLVKRQKGLISLSAGRPTNQGKNEYALITNWESQEALVDFTGEYWERAVIPHGMEKYVKECWVHHYEEFHSA